MSDKTGLIFRTSNGTPHLYANLEDHWLDPILDEFDLNGPGCGWHMFRRFRNSWLRKQRVQEDLRKLWLGHKPGENGDMGEVYSALRDDVDTRWEEVERVGYGFVLPTEDVPNVPKIRDRKRRRKVSATGILVKRITKAEGV